MNPRATLLSTLNDYSLTNFKEEIALASSDYREGRPGNRFKFSEAPRWLTNARDLLRSQLRNEITLDFDRPTAEENLEGARCVSKVLRERGVPYWPFFSGNRGFHLTFFIDTEAEYPVALSPKMVRARLRLPDLKLWLMYHLIGKERIEEFKLDIERAGQPKRDHNLPPLWRCCGSVHPKSGRRKTFLPTLFSEIPEEPLFPSTPIMEWAIPEELLRGYLDRRIEEAREKLRRRGRWAGKGGSGAPLPDIIALFPQFKEGLNVCPFHADNDPSLSITGPLFHCFGCGTEGNTRHFIERMKFLEVAPCR